MKPGAGRAKPKTPVVDLGAGSACACEVRDGSPRSVVDAEIKAKSQGSLRRIEGQLRGLQRMLEEERYCPEILTQMAAVQEALRSVARGLMRNHLKHCVDQAHGTKRADRVYEELLELVFKQSR
jgi:CsoR family transcriptional regulator, copper-sensing transcriptional repressor